MSTPKPNQTLAGQDCPICNKGKFELVQIDHCEQIPEDNPIVVRSIWVDRCSNCGEIVFPDVTTHYIESVVAEQEEQLSPRELEREREDLGVSTQDEMSEIMGLGTKTYHKWESGAQFPNRSMCYYIRVLVEFPEAFDWLRRRAWRQKNRLVEPNAGESWKIMFPDLDPRYMPDATNASAKIIEPTKGRINPALGLNRTVLILQ